MSAVDVQESVRATCPAPLNNLHRQRAGTIVLGRAFVIAELFEQPRERAVRADDERLEHDEQPNHAHHDEIERDIDAIRRINDQHLPHIEMGRVRGLEFMDLNTLANFLAAKPKHPVHRAPLDATNIAEYAFRIR